MAKGLRMTEEQLAEIQKRRSDSGFDAKGARDATLAAITKPGGYRDDAARRADLVARAANGEIEPMFQLQLLEAGLPRRPYFQHQPIAGRKFRLDVAFPLYPPPYKDGDYRGGIGFEVQGHVHRIKHQFLRDMERHNLLTEAGWTMYYVSGDMVRDGRALALAQRVIR